jgi:MFS family permease
VTPATPVEGHARLDDPDELLDPRADPAAFEFGTSGSEAASDLNWLRLLTTRVQRRALASDRHRWWVLSALLAGLLALNFTFTVFIVALPTVAKEFGTSPITLSWTMIGPLLAYGLAAPLFGKVGDIFGHRRLYLVGLAGAMVSAVLTAVAPTAGILILARTLDGVQGAATGTASMALIMSAFPAEERVKAMGWWSLVGAGGPVLGMSIGSPIIQFFGWRALFWLQLVLLVLAMAVVAVVLPRRATDADPEHRAQAVRAFRAMDWVGSWSLSFSVVALMLGLSLGQEIGWLSAGAWACWVVALVGIVVFVRRIRRSANPLIPPAYFRRRNFSLPLVQRSAGNFAYFGAFFLAPLVMEYGYGFSISKVGIVSIARPLAFAISSPIAGYVAVKVGERTTAVFGAVALCGSLALFAALAPSTPLVVLLCALALSGLGMGVAMPATSSIMANEVLESDFGVMSAAGILAMQVGEVAGIQVLLTLQQHVMNTRGLTTSSHPDDLLGTFRLPFLVGTAVAGVALVAATLLRPRRRDAALLAPTTGGDDEVEDTTADRAVA